MSTNETEQDRRQMEDILSTLSSASTIHTTDEQGSPRRFIDIHIYDLPPEGEEPSTVESILQDEETNHTDDQPGQEPDEPLSTPSRARRIRPIITIGVLCIVSLLLLAGTQLLPIVLAPWATITIVPVSQDVRTTNTVTVGGADAQVAGRSLATLTMSQARTIPTTGKGHQDANAAHGMLTFYNASLDVQIVPGGTVLTAANGVQIVTEQDAVIAAGSLATNGHSTVPAHALLTGPQGNMAAGAIYGACCQINVFAASSRFAGGQEARDYPTVTRADIEGVSHALTGSLIQSATFAVQAQVHADETLITPLSCTPHVTADHQGGDEAAQVSVTVDETCQGQTYQTQALHDAAIRLLTQAAMKQLGTGYELMGMVQTSITQPRGQGTTVRLDLTSTGTWSYQFSEEQVQHLKASVAGTNVAEAKTLLLHTRGVQMVSISLSHGETVPSETSKIAVVWLNYAL